MGVDVARFGDDQSVITFRQGRKVFPQLKYRSKDTMEMASLVADQINKERPSLVFVDEAGLGAGVVDRLRQLGYGNVVIGVIGAHRPNDVVAYANKRVEMWGRMRDWLKQEVELPFDNELQTELAGPSYSHNKKEQILLEKKEDMKRRGMSSPDCADSLSLTFAESSVYGNLYENEGDIRYDRQEDPVGRSLVGGY